MEDFWLDSTKSDNWSFRFLIRHEFKWTIFGFVAVRSAEELRSPCKALLMLPGRRIDQRRTDGLSDASSCQPATGVAETLSPAPAAA
jgi:hypothetical protein